MQSRIKDPHGLQLLEFGCGGGQFADRLHKLGYAVKGIDSSPAMISSARARYGTAVDFVIGTAASVEDKPTYDVITTVMTLEFIPDIEDTLGRLTGALKPNGLLVFAAHNPDFVADCAREGTVYVDFDSVEHPTKGFLKFSEDAQVALCVRTAAQYENLIKPFGWEPLLETYPPFTAQYLKQYPSDVPTDHSEYMMLGFQKKN